MVPVQARSMWVPNAPTPPPADDLWPPAANSEHVASSVAPTSKNAKEGSVRPYSKATSWNVLNTEGCADHGNDNTAKDNYVDRPQKSKPAPSQKPQPSATMQKKISSIKQLMSKDSFDDDDEDDESVSSDDNLTASFSNAPRRRRATWSVEEDELLKTIVPEQLNKTGKTCWSTISRLMPDRDSKQCRDRWLNHLDPQVQKHATRPWTDEEDSKLVNFIKKHGTRWRLMQISILPDRTELNIKNRWNSAMKRRYTRYLAKQWGVPEKNIRILNSQGLLDPGVDVEQLLAIAKHKANGSAMALSKPTSSRSIIREASCKNISDDDDQRGGDPLARMTADDGLDHIMAKGQREDHTLRVAATATGQVAGESSCRPLNSIQKAAYVKVVKGRMSDHLYEEDLGIVEVPIWDCFAATRPVINDELKGAPPKWKYSVPGLGIISSKQEIDLGPMIPLLQNMGNGSGSKASPAKLLIVELA